MSGKPQYGQPRLVFSSKGNDDARYLQHVYDMNPLWIAAVAGVALLIWYLARGRDQTRRK